MSNDRAISRTERLARRAAQVLAMQAQGFTVTEIARELGVARNSVVQDLRRVEKRITTSDASHWRKVQLLRYERLYAACETILVARHIVVSNGHVVSQYVLDEDGKPIWDPVYGPDGEPITNDDGQVRVEQRKMPLEDHGAVLETLAEMRKIEDAISKLLGTQTPVKQAVELQHVAYEIKGVDMDKVLGTSQD